MESTKLSLLLAGFLLVFVSVSASSFISEGAFGAQAMSTGRNLLQAKKSCPVDFEFLNYTIIKTRCKGPKYTPEQCCSALKDFACPYVTEINDLTTECATIMFSYITLYGNYPPGLFASLCKEGKQGLECSSFSPSKTSHLNGTQLSAPCSFLFMLTTLCILMFLIL